MLGSHARRPPRRRGNFGVRAPARALGPVRVRPAFKHEWMDGDQLSATELLIRAGAGEAGAVESMFPVVYDELRRLAHQHLSRESSSRTLPKARSWLYTELYDGPVA